MADQSDDVKAIRQLVHDWHDGWQNSDIESILSLFAEYPVLLPQGRPPVSGRKEIRSLYQSFFKVFTVKGECDIEELEVSGDLGYIWVNYTLTATPLAGGKQIEEDSKTIFIVRRQLDNTWKISRLIDNSNREPG